VQLTQAKEALQTNQSEMREYEAEVIKIIRGESQLSQELLNRLYEASKERTTTAEETVNELESKIKNEEQMKETLAHQYDTLQSWADIYDECDMERKKMILSKIMETVKVKRNYEVEIDLTIDCEQLGLNQLESFADCDPMPYAQVASM